MGKQVRLNLRHRVHRHVDHDQQAGATEVERHRVLANQQFRQRADQRQIQRANGRQPRQHIVEIAGGVLARPNTGNEAAMLAKIIGRLLGIENNRRVEEGKKQDRRHIERQIQRLAMGQDTG